MKDYECYQRKRNIPLTPNNEQSQDQELHCECTVPTKILHLYTSLTSPRNLNSTYLDGSAHGYCLIS